MARLSTQYDKEVGKVYMVRGDEAYARTTDTKLTIIDDPVNSRDDISGYRCGFKYDVLRDIGSSNVVLCNGEDELAMYEWSSDYGERYVGVQSNHTTIDTDTCLTLAYGVEHQLYMKYKGNKQCLRSKSRITTIHEPLPDKFKTELDLTYTITSQGALLTITVTVNGQHIPATHNKVIEIYVDGELVDTATTGANTNVATKSLTLAGGKEYSVTAVLQGDETIHMSSATIDIPVGYGISFTETPLYVMINMSNIFKVKVSDMADTPVSGATVTLNELSATTDSSGIATFNVTIPSQDDKYQATFNDIHTDEITIPSYNPALTMSRENTNMYSDNSPDSAKKPLVISFNQSAKDIPISVVARNYDWNNKQKGNSVVFHKTYTTNSDGKVNIYLNDEDPNTNYTRRVISAYVGQYPNYNVETESSMVIDKVVNGWSDKLFYLDNGTGSPTVDTRCGIDQVNGSKSKYWTYVRNSISSDVGKHPTLKFPLLTDWALEIEGLVFSDCSSINVLTQPNIEYTIPKRASPCTVQIYKNGTNIKAYVDNSVIWSVNYSLTDKPTLKFTGVSYPEWEDMMIRSEIVRFNSMRYMSLV